MSVKIRLRKVGKKKQPYFRIVATDSTSPRDGRFIETIGFYDPSGVTTEKKIKVSKEKLDLWLKNGAQPSESLKTILKSLK